MSGPWTENSSLLTSTIGFGEAQSVGDALARARRAPSARANNHRRPHSQRSIHSASEIPRSTNYQGYAINPTAARMHELTSLLLYLGWPVNDLFWNDNPQGHGRFIEYAWPLFEKFKEVMEEQRSVSLAAIRQTQRTGFRVSSQHGHDHTAHRDSQAHPQAQSREASIPRFPVNEQDQQNNAPKEDMYDISFGDSISPASRQDPIDYRSIPVQLYENAVTHDSIEVEFQEGFYPNTSLGQNMKTTHSTGPGLFRLAEPGTNRQVKPSSASQIPPTVHEGIVSQQEAQQDNARADTAVGGGTLPVADPPRAITSIEDVPLKLRAMIRSLVTKAIQIACCPIDSRCTMSLDQETILRHLMGSEHLDIYGKTLHLVYDRSRNVILTKDHVTDHILGVVRCLSSQTIATPKVFNANRKLGHPCIITGCNQVEKDRFNVTRHIKAEHVGIHESRCDTCGSWFTREDNLKQHSAVHQR